MARYHARATPKSYSGERFRAEDFPPALRDHPRFGEWIAHVRMRRFPLAFQEWLAEAERIEAGKSKAGAALQRLMNDEVYCRQPLRVRVHRKGHGGFRK